MPYSIEIDTKNTIVIGKFWGVLDKEEYSNYLDELENDGPFQAPFRLLLLLHEDLKLTMSTEAVRASAKRSPQFSKNCMRVIVAPNTLSFGLSRLYSAEAPSAADKYSVVDSSSKACELLNLDENCVNLTI